MSSRYIALDEKTLSLQRIFWILLAAIIIASFSLLVIAYALEVSPVLAMFLILFASVIILTFVPSHKTKRLYKVVFLCVTVVVSGFTLGVYAGVFESIVLLPDSIIDMSRSEVILHIQNNGLTDLTINEVKVGDIRFVLEYPTYVNRHVQPGGSAYLTIDYVYDTFWGPSLLSGFENHRRLQADKEISPTTFQNNSTYDVTLTTNGVLKHSFEIKARLTSPEQLSIRAGVWFWRNGDGADILIRFNTTTNYVFVYSIQMVNITFYFKPPGSISKYEEGELQLGFGRAGDGFGWSSDFYSGRVYATPTPKFSMLEEGETYSVVVTTMTNNLYTTNVTI